MEENRKTEPMDVEVPAPPVRYIEEVVSKAGQIPAADGGEGGADSAEASGFPERVGLDLYPGRQGNAAPERRDE